MASVERLREIAGWTLMSTPAREAVLEAADEIERLREELAEAVAAGMAALEALRREQQNARDHQRRG